MTEITVGTTVINLQDIEQVGVSSSEFTELAGTILNKLTTDNNSAFKDVLSMFEDTLERNTELDVVQKQSAYADFLKSVYMDVNRQALNSAMDLLKTNEQLVLERYKVMADYNMTLANIATAAENRTMVAKQVVGQDKANLAADQALVLARLSADEMRAKLQKQYGVVPDTYNVTVGEAGHFYTPKSEGGVLSWYEVNDKGEMLTADFEPRKTTYVTKLTAEELELINTYLGGEYTKAGAYTEDDWGLVNLANAVYNDHASTTTDVTLAKKAVMTSPVVGAGIVQVNGANIMDKQIAGYDLINYKDALKTLDERAALMQNAKIPQTANEKYARNVLMSLITDGKIVAL